jgi:hypothetical protein
MPGPRFEDLIRCFVGSTGVRCFGLQLKPSRRRINRDDPSGSRRAGLAAGGERRSEVEEWIERSNGKLRADVAHDNLVALGFTGSERTTRRAVAVVKKSYCLGRVFVCYDPLPGQNFTGGSRLSLVGSGARGQCQEEYRRQQKRIAAVDIRAPMHEERRQVCAYLH